MSVSSKALYRIANEPNQPAREQLLLIAATFEKREKVLEGLLEAAGCTPAIPEEDRTCPNCSAVWDRVEEFCPECSYPGCPWGDGVKYD